MRTLFSSLLIICFFPCITLAHDYKKLNADYLVSLQRRPIPLRDLNALTRKILSENKAFTSRDELLWLGVAASSLALAGQSQILIDLLPRISKEFRLQDFFSNTLITLAHCQYLKYHGKYSICLDLLSQLKPSTPSHTLRCNYCIVDLALYQATIIHSAGDSKKALEGLNRFAKLNPQLNPYQKDWIECLKAQIDMDRGNSKSSSNKFKSLGHLLDNMEDGKLTGSVYKYYWQWVRLSLLIDLGKEKEAEIPLNNLARELSSHITGPTFLSGLIHFDLVKIAILTNNNLKIQQLMNETKLIISTTPDVNYLQDFISVLKTNKPDIQNSILVEIKKKMGPNNPEVLRLERFMKRVSAH